MVPRPQSHSVIYSEREHEAELPVEKGLRKEILCDGFYYDITDFVQRHPGGRLIEFYICNGEDATLAIQQFHHRSSAKVNAILNSFKRRPAREYDCKSAWPCLFSMNVLEFHSLKLIPNCSQTM